MLFISNKIKPGSAVLYRPNSKAIKDLRVLDTLKFILDRGNFKPRYIWTLFSHPDTCLAMKPNPLTSSVFHNPSNKNMKDMRFLETLIFIIDG